jgi:SAM-dependent methyltransferase
MTPRRRLALSAPKGRLFTEGDPTIARLLGDALSIPFDADPRLLTHGFHSYPARFHPLLCRRLLEERSFRGATVLDPFVGSGTTLVEAALAGARGFGVDINPLAVALSRLKATPRSSSERALLLERAQSVTERSLLRVKSRARTSTSGRQYDDPRYYAPHIFRELVGLKEEIDTEPEAVKRTLLLVLSSILIKVSRQPSETAAGHIERSLAKGHPTRLFQRKAVELETLLAEFAAAVPERTPSPDVRLCDARRIRHIRDHSIDLILTSPPYLGTYDYASQHARRFGWLGFDPRKMERLEIGSRRSAHEPRDAEQLWQSDVDAFMREMVRVARGGARIYLAIGDSTVQTTQLAGDEPIRRSLSKWPLRLVASAAIEQPNFNASTGRATRREHLLCLERLEARHPLHAKSRVGQPD